MQLFVIQQPSFSPKVRCTSLSSNTPPSAPLLSVTATYTASMPAGRGSSGFCVSAGASGSMVKLWQSTKAPQAVFIAPRKWSRWYLHTCTGAGRNEDRGQRVGGADNTGGGPTAVSCGVVDVYSRCCLWDHLDQRCCCTDTLHNAFTPQQLTLSQRLSHKHIVQQPLLHPEVISQKLLLARRGTYRSAAPGSSSTGSTGAAAAAQGAAQW